MDNKVILFFVFILITSTNAGGLNFYISQQEAQRVLGKSLLINLGELICY